MLIRLGLNTAIHAAAGVAVAGLALVAAEGWRRAYKAGGAPELDRRGRAFTDTDDADHAPFDAAPLRPGEAGPGNAGPGNAGPAPGGAPR